MKKYGLVFLFVLSVASGADAEEYNSITNFGYSDLDFSEGDRDELFAETTYYFSAKSSLGPLREFEFINKSSSLSAAYFHSTTGFYNSDDFALGGEYFSKTGFVIGGNLTTFGRDNFNTFSLGYLFTPNFLMKFYNTEGTTYAKMRYNYQLNGSDYVGFDVSTDIVFDWQIFSSKYFSKVGDDKYMSLEFNYLNDNEWDDYWRAAANYYFTKNSSLGIDYDENSDYRVGFSHFFNQNVAIEASYGTILENPFKYKSFGSDIFKTIWNTDRNLDKIELGVTVQF
ncbi:putative porin [Microbulbifer sp. A4B17]|uniref:putative porin n=1 Tax=Microbulbifer sp. A4B17 TaxID=359370 RepID=UPI0013007389|nr:putative porin [Microbulbifer sp. A4B17]